MTLEEFEKLPDETVEGEDWPDCPEQENKFDWSMSMNQMKHLYPPEKDPSQPFTPSLGYHSKSSRRKWFERRAIERAAEAKANIGWVEL